MYDNCLKINNLFILVFGTANSVLFSAAYNHQIDNSFQQNTEPKKRSAKSAAEATRRAQHVSPATKQTQAEIQQ